MNNANLQAISNASSLYFSLINIVLLFNKIKSIEWCFLLFKFEEIKKKLMMKANLYKYYVYIYYTEQLLFLIISKQKTNNNICVRVVVKAL